MMCKVKGFGFAAQVMILLALVSLAYAQSAELPMLVHVGDHFCLRFAYGGCIDTCEISPGDCRTQTRGAWRQTCSRTRDGNPGCIRDQCFPTAFRLPTGLIIGGYGGYTIQFDSSGAVRRFLDYDATGPSGVLDHNYVNPISAPWPPVGTFGAQVTTLAVTLGFGDVGCGGFSDIRGFYIHGGPFNGWTVDALFALANRVLGGNLSALPSGVSLSNLNAALDSVNHGCDNGTDYSGNICPNPPCGIKVYWYCPLDGPPVFSWVRGCQQGSVGGTGCNEDCTPYTGLSLHWTAHFDSNSTAAPGGWWSAVFTADDSGCVCVSFDRQLAVELLDFTAAVGAENITLRWSTASESDNDYFEILRDGVRVHRESSVGNSTSRTDYAWTDELGLTTGNTFVYTLTAVDIAGLRHQLATQQVTLGATGAVAREFALEQNYPNPFNPVTTIAFSLGEQSTAKLSVYDLAGRQVASLLNETRDAGRHEVTFNAGTLPTGVYFYELQAGSFSAVRKMVLMK
jgi:hypothetical protein